MQLDYEDVINNLKIKHSDTITNTIDGLQFLIDSKSDGISYKRFRQFLLLNVAVLEKDTDENYFYEFILNRDGDIFDNFKLESTNENLKFSYIIGGNIYESNEINELITVAASYSHLKIRVTFLEKPNIDDEFSISYRVYLLDTETRYYLMNNIIKTKSNLYKEGVCSRLEN
jgi:hypothetical protein